MGDGESDDPCSEDYNMTFVLPDHFEGPRWIESRDEVVSSGSGPPNVTRMIRKREELAE